jgi:hypothetical protein
LLVLDSVEVLAVDVGERCAVAGVADEQIEHREDERQLHERFEAFQRRSLYDVNLMSTAPVEIVVGSRPPGSLGV